MNRKNYGGLTWENGYEVHCLTTSKKLAPDESITDEAEIISECRVRVHQRAHDQQRDIDGYIINAIRADGTKLWVRLVGDDYGLSTTGTGDMIVRYVSER